MNSKEETKGSTIPHRKIMDTNMYKKRPGTSGIRGHLYETKLLSLLLFRAVHDEDVEEFYLGSNIDNVGAFDDVCFKAKIKGFDHPIALFIQIKHRESNKTFTLENKSDLTKYFESYRKIRNSFAPNNNDRIFKGLFEETQCFFILYTNAKAENRKQFASSLNDKLHDLIGTGDDKACKIEGREKYFEFLVQSLMTEQMKLKTKTLAKHLAKFVCSEYNYKNMFDDLVIVHNHIILADEVFLTSEIQPEGYRYVTFRNDLFEKRNDFNMFLKNELSIETLKRKRVKENDVQNLLIQLSDESSDTRYEALLKLTETVMAFKDGKLEFVVEMKEDLKNLLHKIDISLLNIEPVMETAAKRVLGDLHFKVPAAFGHKDLYIRGNKKKVEKRLKHLELKITELLLKSEPDRVVTIDDSIEDGLLRLNGGLAGAVGNLLVLDKHKKLLKFTNSCDELGDNGIVLFTRIKLQNDNFDDYRFHIKTERFPKLTFDLNMGEEENLVRDFLCKLLFYSNQAEVDDVGIILKEDIEEKTQNIFKNVRVKSDAVAIAYHNEIQKWWMQSQEAPYLVKECKIYEDVVRSIIDDPLTSAMNIIYKNKLKCVSWLFNVTAIRSLGLEVYPISDNEATDDTEKKYWFLPMTVIITKMIVFTVMKIFQHFEHKDIIVLDVEYILKLYPDDFNAILTELKNINKNLIHLIVYGGTLSNREWVKKFERFAKVMDKKNMNVIIITHEKSFNSTVKYFSQIERVVKDEKNDLVDFSEESQHSILEQSRICFQGEEISLSAIIDDESKALVKVDTLDEIYRDDGTIVISQSLSNSKYDEIKEFYIDRRVAIEFKNNVQLVKNEQSVRFIKYVKSFYDIELDIVVLTATPGMGKSTLLTHLSLHTKKIDPTVWIVRIDLLENTETFSKWQADKTVIQTLEALEFLCRHIIKMDNNDESDVEITLVQSYDEILLAQCTGNESKNFQLNMFLHFYNRRRIIFLFDGFDEICPHYITEALTLLKVISINLRKHRMWIASRSYNDLTAVLEREFGTSLMLDYFTDMEQISYLNKIWRKNLVMEQFNEEQRVNVHDFIRFMETLFEELKTGTHIMKLPNMPLLQIYLCALKYLMSIRPNKYLEVEYSPSVTMILTKNPFKNLFFNARHDLMLMCLYFSIPLHLYVTADYFLSLIKDNRNTKKWDLDVNTYTMYEHLLDIKLTKIRFGDKNTMILSKPDVKMLLDDERAKFIAMHKKLAVYAIFHTEKQVFFDDAILKEIYLTIKNLKQGTEKTGLIHKIMNNIPIFVHMTVAEYFAVEYICDILKSGTQKVELMWDFILNVMFFEKSINILNIMDHKLKFDDDLRRGVENSKAYIFDLLIAQGSCVGPSKIRSSLTRAVSENWGNFVSLFVSLLDSYLNENNLNEFINIIKNTELLKYIRFYNYVDLEGRIRNMVRKIDEAKLDCFRVIIGFQHATRIYASGPTDPNPYIHALAKFVTFE